MNYSVTVTNSFNCSASATSTITVNPLPVVNAGPDITLCNQPIPYNLTGFSPPGGSWSGINVTPGGVFTPNGTGTFTLTYTYTDANNCANQDQVVVTVVNPNPADAGADFSICNNGAPVTLTGVPSGGSWSGSGINGNTFDPNGLSVGNHTLTYSY